MEFSGRKVDAAAMGVGIGAIEAIGAGADDAAVDDAFLEVVFGECGVGLLEAGELVVTEGDDVMAVEGRFVGVGEADAVAVLMIDGRGGDDACDADGGGRACRRDL